MDSLIVMRKPLRKSQLTPKLTIPKKPKKAAPRSELFPGSPAPIPQLRQPSQPSTRPSQPSPRPSQPSPRPSQPSPRPSQPPSQPSVSFVQLYRELVLQPIRPRRRLGSPLRPRLHFNSLETLRSDTSIVTRYKGHSGGDMNMSPRPYTGVPPTSAVRTELMLELDYGNIFNDSTTS